MKNAAIFPFERNRYFYGKLLSVDDFELEQKYVNDKRRMVNRLICGTGIVAGLYVVMVDERTISVETGVALDSFGREIAVDTPVIRKLSLIDGFESCADIRDGSAFLCIEYEEEETSLVHNIAGNLDGTSGGGQAASRIREGYRLYLTNQRPEDPNLPLDSLYEERVVIYSGDGVAITHVMPRFVRAGQEAFLTVEVENLGQPYISFSYKIRLDCLTSGTTGELDVSFDEMLFEKTGHYTLRYPLRAMEASGVEGEAAVDESSFQLYMAKQSVEAQASGCLKTYVTAQDVRQELMDCYHRQAMEGLAGNLHKEPLYLARIYMVKAGDSYIIDHVENAPYRQYVMSNYLNGALLKMMVNDLSVQGRPKKQMAGGFTGEGKRFFGVQVRSGSVEFDLSRGGLRGQRMYSKEVFHGLGFGKILVQIGIAQQDEEVIYGSPGVFEDQKLRVETAVRVLEGKGSFIIGIRLIETVTEGKLTVRWSAIRDVDEGHTDMVEKKIFIKPGILELGLRENYYLETSCVNMTDRRVRWSVKEGGGAVDDNGCYTAPNVPGVYEVTAASIAFPEVRASIFVVVRDRQG